MSRPRMEWEQSARVLGFSAPLCHQCKHFIRDDSYIGNCTRRMTFRNGVMHFGRITDERTDGSCGPEGQYFEPRRQT